MYLYAVNELGKLAEFSAHLCGESSQQSMAGVYVARMFGLEAGNSILSCVIGKDDLSVPGFFIENMESLAINVYVIIVRTKQICKTKT